MSLSTFCCLRRLILDALDLTTTHASRMEVTAAYQLAMRWIAALAEGPEDDGSVSPLPTAAPAALGSGKSRPAEGQIKQQQPQQQQADRAASCAEAQPQGQRDAWGLDCLQLGTARRAPLPASGQHAMSVRLSVQDASVQAYVAVVRSVICSKQVRGVKGHGMRDDRPCRLPAGALWLGTLTPV